MEFFKCHSGLFVLTLLPINKAKIDNVVHVECWARDLHDFLNVT